MDFKRQLTHHVLSLVAVGTVLGLQFGSLSQVASAQCADPRGNAYCSNGGLVNTQNPSPPTNVNVQNPSAGNSNAPNPDAGKSTVQNPAAPVGGANTGQLTVAPSEGTPGAVLGINGQGFGANNLMFLNVVDSAGQILDSDSRAFSCTETDSVLLNLYQDLGWGCSSGARSGPLNHTNADGSFVGAIQIPAQATPGPAQLCAKGVFATTCTPFTIADPNS